METLRARLIPLALLAGAGAGWLASSRLEVWTEDGPGPGLMPKVALALLALLALALVLAPGQASREESGSERGFSRTFLVYAAGSAFMALAVPLLGFVLPGVLTVFAILRFAEERSWAVSAGYAAALIGAVVLLFGTALDVQFPDGPGERALKAIGLL